MSKGSKHLRVLQGEMLRLDSHAESMCELIDGAETDAEKLAALAHVYQWAREISVLYRRDADLAAFLNPRKRLLGG